ncbi:hypothetical protein [Thalassotalea aquiviva]|uniref:hypothetical protein n=1 Tax=Thalassotalea aquiviva TaxID=3242415 RepID=UPI00352AC1D9
MKRLQYFFYLILLLTLSACGGGDPISDGGNPDGNGGNGGTTPIVPTTTIELTIDNPQVSAINPATLTATVTEGDDPVAGVVVQFTAGLGVLDVETGTALTNSEGIATIGLLAGTVEGAAKATASIESGESAEVTFETKGDGANQNVINPTTVVLTMTSHNITADSPATVTAVVSNLQGPIAGQVVTFSSNMGFLLPSSGTALTDSNGQASIQVNAGDVRGAGTITASTSTGEFGEISFETLGDGGIVAGKQVKISLSRNEISNDNPATVSVKVTDENGAVAGEVVNFSSTLGLLDPVSGSALTNDEGIATITLTAGSVKGAALISATLASGEFDAIGFKTEGDANDVIGKNVSLVISTISISEANSATLTATVTQVVGGVSQPVVGDVVNFASTLGALSPNSGTALTNSEGVAIIKLEAGNVPGAGVASVTLDNNATASVGFETAGDQAPKGKKLMMSMALEQPNSDESGTIKDGNDAIITVTVTETMGDIEKPVEGEVVDFSSSLGVLNPFTGTALTNDQGVAQIRLKAGIAQGAGIITARLSSGETDSLGFETLGDAPVIDGKKVELRIATPSDPTIDANKINAKYSAIIIAKVTENDQPVRNEVVEFSSSLGLLYPSSGTALTDAAGEARITLSAGTIQGAGTIVATISNFATDSIGFETAGDEIFVAGPEPTKVEMSLSYSNPNIDLSDPISSLNPVTVTATLTDSGIPRVGEVVTFSTDLGFLTPASGTVLTDTSGQARIVLNAGDIKGAGTITAAIPSGAIGQINFASLGDGGTVVGKQVNISYTTKDGTSLISADNPATVTVKVTDGIENVIGEVVNFSSTLGVLDPVSGTALTDANGTATITLTAGTVKGAGLVTASLASGEFDSIGFATEGDARPVLGNRVTLTIATPADDTDPDAVFPLAKITSTNAATLTATVTDENGVGVPGEVVNFSATLGSLNPGSGTALTNEDGVAVITLGAGTTEGAGIASVTLDNGATASVGFETLGDQLAEGKILEMSLALEEPNADAPNTISDANFATITVKVTDENDDAVVAEVVEFSASLGVLDPFTGTALTDKDGIATITLKAGSVKGAGIVTAKLRSGETDNLGFETLGDTVLVEGNKVALDIELPQDNPSITDDNKNKINANYSATIVAKVTDENGDGVKGEVVEFSSSLGLLSPVSGTALTDISGEARITLSAGTIEGAGTVVATLSNFATDSIGFETAGDEIIVTGPEPTKVTLTLTKQSDVDTSKTTVTEVTGEEFIWVNVKLTDKVDGFETPRVNEVVTFATDLGFLSPSSGTVLTGSDGTARIQLHAGDVEGAGTITAVIPSGAVGQVNFASKGDGNAAVTGKQIEIVGLVSKNTGLFISTISATEEAIVRVKVSDEKGAGLNDEVVNFSSSLGVFDPVSGSALTKDGGIAEITLTAGTVKGAALLTAALASGEFDSIGFETEGDVVPVLDKTVTLELIDSQGQAIGTNAISKTNVAKLIATVTDSDGNASGEVVNFSSTLGSLFPASGTALTNEDGVAVIKLAPGTTQGAGVATVTLDNGATASVTFQTLGDQLAEGKILEMSLALEEPNADAPNTISDANFATITVKVTDENDDAVVAEVVEFSASLGVLDPFTGTALTDKDGIATITLKAGSVKGAGIVTAKLRSGETDNLGFETLGDTVLVEGNKVALDIELPQDNPSITDDNKNKINANYSATIVAKVTDENGDGVKGEVVEFSSSLGLLSPVSGTALTDISGEARITLSAGTIEGAGTVVATLSNFATDSIGFETAGDEIIVTGPEPTKVTLTLTKQSDVDTSKTTVTEVTGEEFIWVNVKLTDKVDGFETPRVNEVVTFATDLGFLSPSSGTVLTGSDGTARIQLHAGDVEGAGTITAVIPSGAVGQVNFASKGDGNAAVTGKQIEIVGLVSKNTGLFISTISATEEAIVRVKVSDEKGAGLNDEVVNFSSSLGVFDPVSGSALTKDGGIAEITLTAGTVKGAALLTAALASGEFDSIGFETEGDVVPVLDKTVTLELIDSQGQAIGTNAISKTNVATLKATVTDSDGNASGEVVNFSSTLGSLFPTSGTALTNDSGVAFIKLAPGTTQGAGVASVTLDNGATASVTFQTLGDQLAEGKILEMSLALEEPNADAPNTISDANFATITVKVTDENDDAVVAEVVEFSASLGVLDPFTGTALTDKDGIATITLKAGSVKGAGIVTAKLRSGETDNLGFETLGDTVLVEGNKVALDIELPQDNPSITDDNKNKINANYSATIVAKVTDENGDGVKGEVVEFSSSLGLLSPVSGTALTDISGEARITLSAGTIEGAGTVVATLSNFATDSIGFETAGDEIIVTGPEPTKVTLTLTKQSDVDTSKTTVTEVTGEEFIWVNVKLTDKVDGFETPRVNEVVTFATDLGFLSPSSGTVLTGSDGTARIQLHAGDVEGAGTITAVIPSGAVGQVNFASKGDGNAAVTGKQIEIVGLVSKNTGLFISTISATEEAIVRVKVSDEKGAGLNDEVVNFSSSLGVFDPVSGSALTKDGGIAEITLTAGTVKGAALLTAALASGEFDSIGFETEGDVVPVLDKTVTLELIDSQGQAIGTNAISKTNVAKLIATVTDSDGNASGEVVNFSSTLGSLFPASGTALTNEDGVAVIKLAPGTTQGAGVATVTLDNGATASVTFQTLGDQLAEGKILEMSLALEEPNADAPNTISDANFATITVKVTDENDDAVVAEVVEFSASLGVLDPFTGTALTDKDGIATITLKAGSVKGAGIVTAKLRSGETDNLGFETLGDTVLVEGNKVALDIELPQDNPSITDDNKNKINANYSATIVAKVTDENGDGVKGEVVEFSSSLGLLSPVSGTALTDISGEARITLSAGTIEGAGTVVATLSNFATDSIGFETAGDEIIVTGPEPTKVTLTLTKQSDVDTSKTTVTEVTGEEFIWVNVKLTDKVDGFETPRVNEVVTFATDLGFLSPSSGTVLTGSDGTARIQLHAGDVEGAGTITAVIPSGAVGQVNFASKGDGNAAVTGKQIEIVGLVSKNTGLFISTISATEEAIVRVKVSDEKGAGLNDEVVNFSSSLGVFDPVSGSALTKDGGIAEITLTAGTVKGAALLTAALASGEFDSIGFETEGDVVPVLDKTVTLELIDSQGQAIGTNAISKTNVATLKATVTDSDGNASGEVVNFSSTLGSLFPTSGTALTNDSGVAFIKLAPGTTQGAGVASVTLDNGATASVTFQTLGDQLAEGKILEMSLALEEPNADAPNTISDANFATITVKVTDENDDAVVAEVVEFSASLGVLDPFTGTALTDKDGIATITLKAGSVKGAGIVTAKLRSGETDNLGFETLGDTVLVEGNKVALDIELPQDNPSITDDNKNKINANYSATIVAKVTDENGDGVKGEVVEFSSSLGLLSPVSGTALTDISGEARITLSAGTIEGAGTVVATLSNFATDSIGFETAGDEIIVTGPEPTKVTLTLTKQSDVDTSKTTVTEVTGEEFIWVNVKLTDKVDGFETPRVNEVVTFATDLGFLSPSSGTVLTGSDGTARIQLHAGDVEGAGTITAVIPSGAVGQVNFASKGDGNAAVTGKQIEIVGLVSKNTGLFISTISATEEAIVRVKVSDEKGAGLNDEVVNFSSSLGVFDPVSGSALTKDGGIAEITLTAGTVKGAALLTAALASGEFDSIGFETEGDVVPVLDKTVTLELIDSQGQAIGTNAISKTNVAKLIATVTDSDGNASGEVVNFSSTLGSLFPASGTALTNEDGVAVIKLAPGTTQGAGVATVTLDNGATASVTFQTLGDQLAEGKILEMSLALEEPNADAPNTISDANFATITVKVTDENDDAVVAEVVEFSASLGVLDPFTGTALTDKDGIATITLKAGSVKGAGIVTAKLRSGETDNLGFETLGDTVLVEGNKVALDIELPQDNPSITDDNKNKINANYSATIVAKVTDENGDGVKGEVVEFSSSLGLLSPVSGTALTDISGEARITLSAGTIEGAGTVVATLSNFATDSIGFETAGDEIIVTGPEPTKVTLTLTKQSDVDTSKTTVTEVTGEEFIWVNVKLTDKVDGFETPRVNEVVTFATDLGFLSPSSGTVLTGSDGTARIQLHAGDVEGAGTITAVIPSGAVGQVNFASKGDGNAAVTGKQIEIVGLVSKNTGLFISTISATEEAIVRVKVSDEKGAGLNDEVVNFSSSLGVFDPVSGSALTKDGGIAEITLTAGTVKGAALLTAALASGEFDSIGFETEGDVVPVLDKTVTLELIDSQGQAIGTNAISKTNVATLKATVTDSDGNASGEVVNFSSTLGSLFPTSGTALTNDSGVAFIKLAPGTTQGAGVASVTLDNGATASVTFQTLGDQLAEGNKAVSLSISSYNVSAENPATVTAYVTDSQGGVPYEVVNFSTSLGVINPTSGSALTDENGYATINISAGEIKGAGLIRATLTTQEFDTIGFATEGDESKVVGKDVQIHISSSSVTPTQPATLTVLVTENTVPMAGEVVNFASTLGQLSPNSGTALTDDLGVATITLLAGSENGAGVATATLTNQATAYVDYEITEAIPSVPNTKVVAMRLSSLEPISDAQPIEVIFKVTDAANIPISGEVVEFSSSIGVFFPFTGTAMTNASGEASITLKAGSVKGTGIVSAKLVSGESDSLSFETLGDTPKVIGKEILLSMPVTHIDAKSPATAKARVFENGLPVAREIVEFSATIGELDPFSGTALTNEQGIAEITVTAGSIKGAGMLTATLSTGASDSLAFQTEGDAEVDTAPIGTSLELKLLDDAGNETSSIDKTKPAKVIAILKDANGDGINGEVIAFETVLGILDPVFGTALTQTVEIDGVLTDGVASITLTAGAVEGASVLTATSKDVKGAVSFYTKGDQTTEITVDVVMVTPDTTDEITVINTTTPGQLIATVKGIDSPVIVTFSSDIGEIPIPTAITDENNQAIIDIFAGDKLGAGTITARLKDGEFGEALIVVGATNLEMGSGTPFVKGQAELGEATISAGGTTSVSVDILVPEIDPVTGEQALDSITGEPIYTPYNSPVEVFFSSNCAISGEAILSSPVISRAGKASSTYRADGCVGDDQITVSANAGGINLTATTAVKIEPASAGSIQFVSATPENISLQGVGGNETSTVIFQLLDTNGKPVSDTDVDVDFSLNTDVGGITLDPPSAKPDENGFVQTVVNSGTIATSVRVTAEIRGSSPRIATQSSMLVISTGIPDQDSFSLSAEYYNAEAWNIDDTTVEITARLGDAFNNPVPDGTAVYFTTEGGVIEPSCVTEDGRCVVTWTGQNPRPIDGRVTVLATAIGEESFADLNGNGRFDLADVDAFKGQNGYTGKDVSGTPYDLPEAFLDSDEDGQFDEIASDGHDDFVDFNKSGTFDPADGKYTGSLCAADNTGNCTDNFKSLNVRGSFVLIMASGEALISADQTPDDHESIDNSSDTVVNITGEGTAGASVFISDINSQPMPFGTTVKFSTTAGTIEGPDSFVWPSENTNGGRIFAVSIVGSEEPKNGKLIVEVVSPSGISTVYQGIDVEITAAAPVTP